MRRRPGRAYPAASPGGAAANRETTRTAGVPAPTVPDASTTWQGLSGGESGRRSGQSGNHTHSVRAIVLHLHDLFDAPGALAAGAQGEAAPQQGAVPPIDPLPAHRLRLETEVQQPGGKGTRHRTEDEGGIAGPG